MHTTARRAATLSLSFLLLATAVPAAAQGRFTAAGPAEQHQFAEATSQIGSKIAGTLNQYLDVPEEIIVTSQACEEPDAYYHPDNGRGHPQITICDELIADVRRDLSRRGLAGEKLNSAVVASVGFVYFHQVGHALVDVLELPVEGSEEVAADQVAAFLLQGEPRAARWAAEYWLEAEGRAGGPVLQRLFDGTGGVAVRSTPYADRHGLTVQRLRDVACWTYGADPRENRSVAGPRGLSSSRARRCQRAYAEMESRWGRLLAPHLKSSGATPGGGNAAATGGAGVSEGGGHSPDPGEISRLTGGEWRFEESASDPNDVLRCTASGTIRFAPSGGGQMSQTGTCRAGGREVQNDTTVALSGATVRGDSVSFQSGQHCEYRGAFRGDDALRGTVTCRTRVGGRSLSLTGSWSASRQ